MLYSLISTVVSKLTYFWLHDITVMAYYTTLHLKNNPTSAENKYLFQYVLGTRVSNYPKIPAQINTTVDGSADGGRYLYAWVPSCTE